MEWKPWGKSQWKNYKNFTGIFTQEVATGFHLLWRSSQFILLNDGITSHHPPSQPSLTPYTHTQLNVRRQKPKVWISNWIALRERCKGDLTLQHLLYKEKPLPLLLNFPMAAPSWINCPPWCHLSQIASKPFLSCSLATAQLQFGSLDACFSWRGIEYQSLEFWFSGTFLLLGSPKLPDRCLLQESRVPQGNETIPYLRMS